MVYIDRLVTKSGDSGETSLGDGLRVKKSDLRVELLGKLDSCNSYLGMVLANSEEEVDRVRLRKLSHLLFDLGSYISQNGKMVIDFIPIIEKLEAMIEEINKDLPPLNSFLLPTDNKGLNLLRCEVRECERVFYSLEENDRKLFDSNFPIVLNRLGDLVFVLFRAESSEKELWREGYFLE